MSEERYLTFALGKGRLAKKTLELFEQIGITCEEMKDKKSRKLIFVNEDCLAAIIVVALFLSPNVALLFGAAATILTVFLFVSLLFSSNL